MRKVIITRGDREIPPMGYFFYIFIQNVSLKNSDCFVSERVYKPLAKGCAVSVKLGLCETHDNHLQRS